MKGRRIRVQYPRMPKLCTNCYTQGHAKKDCTNPRVDWTKFVSNLLNSGHFEEDMFGSWIRVLQRHPLPPSDDHSINGWTREPHHFRYHSTQRGRGTILRRGVGPVSFPTQHYQSRGRRPYRSRGGQYFSRGYKRSTRRQNLDYY